jgi:hypothetical protein
VGDFSTGALTQWPTDEEATKALAFSFGAQLEDSWGVSVRRFLAHRGNHANEFDPRTAQWQ